MFSFPSRKPGLGIEITASSIRLVAVSRRGANVDLLFSKKAELPPEIVNETYASPNILDVDRFGAILKECLSEVPDGIKRTALSLPDGVFRVQIFEFDELPGKESDRERLIRWRLEKMAAFDSAETVLRYQVLGHQDKGFLVMACVVKQAVIAQYESVLVGQGLEPWSVGLSSFHILNLLSPRITRSSDVSALAHITGDSFATIVVEGGGARFYRYKEIKRTGADEIKMRFMREIEDSLHFYTHMDRTQQSEVKNLFLAGEERLSTDLAEGFKSATSREVEVLSPAVVVSSANGVGVEMTAALGAGSSL
jgi:Tfp pilus assembly PilM family ATPase